MVTQAMPVNNPLSTARLLSIVGAVTAIFSLLMGLLVLFVLPGGCSFLGIIELLLLAGLFVAGLISFLVGRVLLPRMGKA